jgi:hypothetical protein
MASRRDEDEQAERSAARDFVMARALAAGAMLNLATEAHAEFSLLFVNPDDDSNGAKRKALLEDIDTALGEAAALIQIAMAELPNIDPREEEPEADEDGDDDDDDGPPEKDEPPDDGRPRRSRGRRR